MNKFAFLSGMLTLLLSFFQFIPLGVTFGSSGVISNWILTYFGLSNPFVSFYSAISLELMSVGEYQVFLWGIINNGILYTWIEIHLVTFIFLFCLSILSILSAFIASGKEDKLGKRMNNFNIAFIGVIFAYFLIGIPIYSNIIVGIDLGYFNIFYYLNFGFYVLLLDLILAIVAMIKHPIN
jgi:hypothetical protein